MHINKLVYLCFSLIMTLTKNGYFFFVCAVLATSTGRPPAHRPSPLTARTNHPAGQRLRGKKSPNLNPKMFSGDL